MTGREMHAPLESGSKAGQIHAIWLLVCHPEAHGGVQGRKTGLWGDAETPSEPLETSLLTTALSRPLFTWGNCWGRMWWPLSGSDTSQSVSLTDGTPSTTVVRLVKPRRGKELESRSGVITNVWWTGSQLVQQPRVLSEKLTPPTRVQKMTDQSSRAAAVGGCAPYAVACWSTSETRCSSCERCCA